MVSSNLFRRIETCRICKSTDLHRVMDLGMQALTGRFPASHEPDPPVAPLEMVRCGNCGLVQLRHSVSLNEMFSERYGYRSGTNATMRSHLGDLTRNLASRAKLAAGDVALDIGCNDGTLLKSYPVGGLVRLGIDPIADVFRDQYTDELSVEAQFFSAAAFDAFATGQKARAITSIAMFYDLDEPGQFVADIAGALSPDGIWVLEQSYLLEMLDKNSFDTICHEHLEYYGLAQIERLMSENGLRVFDVQLNSINGGSFQVWACHHNAPYEDNLTALQTLRDREICLGLSTAAPFDTFCKNVETLGRTLVNFIREETASGKRVYVYGASTKGNVLLQHYRLDSSLITACADRSPTKWGLRTPGTSIPIVSEEEAREQADYFLVLPWHFRDEFVSREKEFIVRGRHFIFPLPHLEIVGNDQSRLYARLWR
jgi:NDP-4-keto-2,6-dideoxyhexose 3-C-methyltransferase